MPPLLSIGRGFHVDCVRAMRARRLVPEYRLVCKIGRLLASPGTFWPSLLRISRFWRT
jgi:hypothetical protein